MPNNENISDGPSREVEDKDDMIKAINMSDKVQKELIVDDGVDRITELETEH